MFFTLSGLIEVFWAKSRIRSLIGRLVSFLMWIKLIALTALTIYQKEEKKAFVIKM